jgi:hypothetical protein
VTARPSRSRCFIFWSVSTKRGSVSSDASSIGVCEVPAANTILAMSVSRDAGFARALLTQSLSVLKSLILRKTAAADILAHLNRS